MRMSHSCKWVHNFLIYGHSIYRKALIDEKAYPTKKRLKFLIYGLAQYTYPEKFRTPSLGAETGQNFSGELHIRGCVPHF